MRVVAGEARGRRLQAPPGTTTRPTLDRVREALFNALGSLDAVDGATVLDLFAGSGALGIEALSRGAARAVFVERDAGVRRVLAANLESTGLVDRSAVVAAEASAYLDRLAGPDRGPTFDLVLLDPPYETTDVRWDDILRRVGSLVPGATVVIESDAAVAVPEPWHVLREKWYGSTLLIIASPTPPEIS